MNGKTNEDEILNPCTAELDRNTWGFKYLNFSTWGNRWIRFRLFFLQFDLHRSQYGFGYTRIKNGASYRTPIGSVDWPMPIRRS